MLDHSCQVQRNTNEGRGLDLYETPPEAVRALLRVERIPHKVWEPAAGRGAIVRVLRAAGHEVVTSDIVQRDFELDAVGDFLKMTKLPEGCEAILTNPAFLIAAQFIAHALELCPRVIMLLRLAFLEAGELGDKRPDRHLRSLVLDGGQLARVHIFRKRLPMMHRAGWEGRKSNSGMAFGWFVWERAHRGPPSIHRISWERPEPPAPALGRRGRPKKGKEKGASGTIKRGSNSRAYVVARLLRDGHAGLAAEVRAGRISARAAAIQFKNRRRNRDR
jgi:hypothetical protein